MNIFSYHALQNSVNVQTKRVGGAYGGKASRALMVGSACAIAANELSRPVRIALDLNTNMSIVNGRTPYYCQYKVRKNVLTISSLFFIRC